MNASRMDLVTKPVKGPTRRERAVHTRARIVDAATEEFRASGYHGTPMAAIAKRAGVAVQTVYFVFNTKPALLTAAIDHAVMGDEDLPPQAMPWWQECTTTTDGRRAVELFVDSVVTISRRAASLDRVAAAASTTDPEIVDLVAHHETMRREGFRQFVDSLAQRDLLARGRSTEEVVDVLLTVLGSDVYLNFTESCGWSVERYAEWATTTLTHLYIRTR